MLRRLSSEKHVSTFIYSLNWTGKGLYVILGLKTSPVHIFIKHYCFIPTLFYAR